MLTRFVLLASVAALVPAAAQADFDVQVDFTNLSAEVKTDWPVVLKIHNVLGRNLPLGSVNPSNFHVTDPSGKEVPHGIEAVPPYDHPGASELILVIPKINPGQTLSYRIVNNARRSSMRRDIDVVNSRHNLLANGDFEKADDKGRPSGLTGAAKQDTRVKHSGRASLALSADGATVSARYARSIDLHKGSWYYFGVWSRTDNVGRFGYGAGRAAHFKLLYLNPSTPPKKGQPAPALGPVMRQCSTRDWLKLNFEYSEWNRERPHTNWGVDRPNARATEKQATVEFVLEQRRHYYMEPGKTKGSWWLDGACLMEQPAVNVRFDLAIKPALKEGVFLFDRTSTTPPGSIDEKKKRSVWCSRPFVHEKAGTLERFAVKGQRVIFSLGLYHTRPLESVTVKPAGMALVGPGGTRLPLEAVEYCPGFMDGGSRWMRMVGTKSGVTPVAMPDKEGVRLFFVAFVVPRKARPGRYTGSLEVQINAKHFQTVPLLLRVQDLEQPILRDLYVGNIYQGGAPPPISDEMLKAYGRCGFSSIMWFSRVIPYKRGPDGRMHVDPKGLNTFMQKLLANGITAGCGIYSEIQLDDKPRGPGTMVRMAREEVAAAAKAAKRPGAPKRKLPTEKSVYARLLRELDAAAKAHPEWPRIIHMNWDEPPPFNAKMGWTNEILPDAITTLDVQFDRIARCIKYYNTPAFDDPADWAGPELYAWVKRQGKDFGFCGAAGGADEHARYQLGMMMAASGARYYHCWHHGFGLLSSGPDRKPVRGICAISSAAGMDDLKAWYLLKRTIKDAKKTDAKAAAVKAAEDYLAGVFAVWNGDHKQTWGSEPYLGFAFTWGAERFYDRWQEQMLRHAAAIKGVKWVE